MRPFRPYDPQGPRQIDSGPIVHHRNRSYGLIIQGLSPLVPLELTLNDPIVRWVWRNGMATLPTTSRVLRSQPDRYTFFEHALQRFIPVSHKMDLVLFLFEQECQQVPIVRVIFCNKNFFALTIIHSALLCVGQHTL